MNSRIFVALLCAAFARPVAAWSPGEYRNKSAPIYTGQVTTSEYVTVRDGTRLAITIHRPAVDGKAVDTKYPVVWVYSNSRRGNYDKDGKVALGMRDGFELIRYGYVFAVAESRGKGASFGVRKGIADQQEIEDGYDLTEWLAKQSWSDGNIGMYGGASLGKTQFSAAHLRPPHLKAIFVGLTEFDRYDGWQRGGIYSSFASSYSKFTTGADGPVDADAISLPVDADADKSQLAAALSSRKDNTPYVEFFRELPYRDSVSSYSKTPYWQTTSISYRVRELSKPGIAMYHAGGWFAESRRDTLLMPRNFKGPQRGILGPWNAASAKPEREAERTAFFDHFLKGIDNGFMDQPLLYYYTTNAPAGQEWSFTKRWPLPAERRVKYYFGAEHALSTQRGREKEGSDTYTARYDITSRSQWETRGAMDLSASDRDAKALTYTSTTLNEDLQITGHPTVSLWVTSSASDADFFVYLETVDAQGNSTYVTDGRLRASHRKLARPFYDTAGLPWHRSFAADMQPLVAGKPAQLLFDLLPTSIVIKAGSRLRVAITNADPGAEFLRSGTPPTVQVLRDRRYPSLMELPLVPVIGAPH